MRQFRGRIRLSIARALRKNTAKICSNSKSGEHRAAIRSTCCRNMEFKTIMGSSSKRGEMESRERSKPSRTLLLARVQTRSSPHFSTMISFKNFLYFSSASHSNHFHKTYNLSLHSLVAPRIHLASHHNVGPKLALPIAGTIAILFYHPNLDSHTASQEAKAVFRTSCNLRPSIASSSLLASDGRCKC